MNKKLKQINFLTTIQKILSKIFHILGWLFLAGWISFTVFIFTWLVFTSLKSNREIFAGVWNLPKILHWDNYVRVLTKFDMSIYFKNSILVVSLCVLFILILSLPPAYVLSRYRFKGRSLISNLFIVGLGIPLQVPLVPLFFLLKKIGLVDSLFGLGIVYIIVELSFTIYLLMGFLSTLPSELEEAALIDGCSPFGVFYRIMLPLSYPGIATAATFNFLFLWNEFLLALVLIHTTEKNTISLGLYALQGQMTYTADWAGLFSGVVIIMLPTLLVYIFLSRRVIAGLTLGAVKG